MILKRVFLNESIVLIIIILNAIVLFLIGFDEFVEKIPELLILDNIFTFIFLIELIVKLKALGLGNYFKDNWNTFDFILIILAIPSLLFPDFDSRQSHFYIKY